MAEPGQPLAAAVDEHRTQAGQVEHHTRPRRDSSGIQAVVRTIARPQPGDSRLNAKAKGATEPSSERRLSAGVRSGCSPCASPATNIARNARPGLNTSG